MVHVELDAILTEEDALQQIKDIFNRVEKEKVAYVITHNGRPTLAIVDIATLEHEGSGEPFHTPEPEMPAESAPEMPVAEPISSQPAQPAEKEAPMVRPDTVTDTTVEDLPPMPDMPSESPVAPISSPLASLDEPSFPEASMAQPDTLSGSKPSASIPGTPDVSAAPLTPTPAAPSQPISPFSSAGEPETDLDNSSPLG